VSEESAGAAYSELIAEQLAEERSRKASLEARGLSVITTSGVLVTLVLGLAAIVTQAATFKLPEAANRLLVFAGALFVLAAVGGIGVNFPMPYREVGVTALRRLTELHWWNNKVAPARRRTAEARINVLAAARSANVWKVRFLLAALVLEVLAVVTLAASASVVLMTR
jgi:hypothetical protein